MTVALTKITVVNDTATAAQDITFNTVYIGPAYVGRVLIFAVSWTHHSFSSLSSLSVDGHASVHECTGRTGSTGASVCRYSIDTGEHVDIHLHWTSAGVTSVKVTVYAVGPVSPVAISGNGNINGGPSIGVAGGLTMVVGGFGVVVFTGADPGTAHLTYAGIDALTTDTDSVLSGEGGCRAIQGSVISNEAAGRAIGAAWDTGGGNMAIAGASWGVLLPEPPPGGGGIDALGCFEVHVVEFTEPGTAIDQDIVWV